LAFFVELFLLAFVELFLFAFAELFPLAFAELFFLALATEPFRSVSAVVGLAGAAAADFATHVQGRMSRATTKRRTTSHRQDLLVTAASTFGTRVTTNGTLVNCVDMRGAGS
jgi:hypothetical protein